MTYLDEYKRWKETDLLDNHWQHDRAGHNDDHRGNDKHFHCLPSVVLLLKFQYSPLCISRINGTNLENYSNLMHIKQEIPPKKNFFRGRFFILLYIRPISSYIRVYHLSECLHEKSCSWNKVHRLT